MNKPTRLCSWTRLRAHLPYKLLLAVGLNVWALLPYYLLQHYPLYPVTKMPPGLLDHWIPFQEHSLWLYLSLFLLQPLAPIQMLHLRQLQRYALGVIVISSVANSIFWLWPTAITRPVVPTPSPLYQSLLTYVTPLNACPSLHAAMAVYSALCWEQLCAGTPRAWAWRGGVWLWALGILYATLSTKEHVAIDALAGSLLGLGSYWVVFRNKRKKAMPIVTAALFAVMCFVNAGNLWADEAAEHDALRKIKALYEEVVSSDDLTRLLPYLPDKLTAVTPTGEEVRSPQQLQAYFHKIWEMIGKQGTYEVKVHVENTELYGDMAVSYGTTDEWVRTAAGKEFRFPMLWTAVIRKDADQWKMVRMHGSIDPLGNVFVRTQLRLTRWMYGAGGVVVGLGVGVLLGLRRRSRAH